MTKGKDHERTQRPLEADQPSKGSRAASGGRGDASADRPREVGRRIAASAEKQAANLKETAASSKDKISGWWDEQQQAWNDRVAKVRKHLDEQKTTYDLVTLENQAELAESDAKFAIDYAYSAIEEAEYTVLDANLARADVSDAIARTERTNA